MRTTRSSALAFSLLLLAQAALAGGQEVRRAAALLDYIARGYGASVVGGVVVNAAEFEEQQAFAQEAAEILEKLPGQESFAGEARALFAEVRARSGGVPAQATSLHARLLSAAGLSTTPPPELQREPGPVIYLESCAACHGAQGQGDGPSARGLSTRPTDFTGADRAQLTPYSVYSAITWGVPRTAMPAFDALGEQKRWQLALYVLTFGLTDEDARRGKQLARARGLDAGPSGSALWVAQSDAELRRRFAAQGFGEADARALLAWVRRIAPFAPPPPAGFPELRTEVALASISYAHGRLPEAQARLRDAEELGWAPLEPLIRAAAPLRVRPVRDAFADARAQVQAPGSKQRVLGAVAQLSRRIAEAAPELQGDEAVLTRQPVLRAAGAGAVRRFGLAAALAVIGALLLALSSSLRQGALVLAASAMLAGAGVELPALWRFVPHVELAAAVLLLAGLAASLASARRADLLALLGAALSAAACAAAIAQSCAAIGRAYPSVGPAFAQSARDAAGLLAVAAVAAALVAHGWLTRHPRWRKAIGTLALGGAVVASVGALLA